MAERKITEIQSHVISMHKLQVGGTVMIEEIKETTIHPTDESKEPRIVHRHKRTMDGKSYILRQTVEAGEVIEHEIISELSQEEQKEFQDKWDNLWKPAIPQDDNARAVEKIKIE